METAIENKQSKVIAWIATLVFHALLILLFILIVFKTPLPPYPENTGMGLEVNLGYSNVGLGEITPNTIKEASSSKVPQQHASEHKIKTVSENIITQQTEDAPSIKSDNKTQTSSQTEQQPSNDVVKALNKLSNQNSNNSSSQGITKPGGDQGNPNGNPNSTNYQESGPGEHGIGTGGPGWKVREAGRVMMERPKIIDDSQEEGKVAVEIIIRKDGTVKSAKAKGRVSFNAREYKSTTFNQSLWKRAEEGVMKAKFNASPTGTDDVQGVIIVNFIVK